MRRGCSVILLVIGGWLLSSVGVIATFRWDDGMSPWFLATAFGVMIAPFLLIGTWMSPGRRWCELGLTLMISAGAGAFFVLTLAAISFDREFQKLIPETMPEFDFTDPAMIVIILLTGGAGYLLWRSGRLSN